MAKKIMLQATGCSGTGVGKSFLVALLCKFFSQDGYKVAPFKVLNLTPVTYVKDGREFGYSQALQAVAAGIEPDWRMNPWPVKPVGNLEFDIFLEGKCVARNYNLEKEVIKGALKQFFSRKSKFAEIKEIIKSSFESLAKDYDIICIEGSGPAKLLGFGPLSGLFDFVNMGVSEITASPVVFVTENIDAIPGVLANLTPEQKQRVRGIILNKFIYDELVGLGAREWYLSVGMKRIRAVYGKAIGKDIVGIIPYLQELSKLPDLDPLGPAPKIPFDEWEKVISAVAKKARKWIDLKKIYEILD